LGAIKPSTEEQSPVAQLSSQAVVTTKFRLRSFIEWLASFLLVLSSLAIIFCLHLPANLANSSLAYLKLDLFNATDFSANNPFKDWGAPWPFLSLGAWLVWLVAAFVLLKIKNINSASQLEPNLTYVPKSKPPTTIVKVFSWSKLYVTFMLLVVVAVAFWQRAAQLLPNSSGQLPTSNYDEMVYFSGATLWARGNWPYHDFLLAHPPLAVLFVGGWLKLLGLAAGGRNAFVAARQLCVFFGVATTAGVFWAAGRLWARVGRKFEIFAASGAALLYAADGRASQVAVLETVANLGAVLSFGLCVEAQRLEAQAKWRKWLMLASGIAAAASFLGKLPGLALFIALVVYLLYTSFFRRWADLVWLGVGFGVGTVGLGGIFIIKGGLGEFLRQVFFFQLLRPQEVRSGIDEVGRISDYAESSLTLLLAALAILVLTWRLLRKQPNFSNDLWLIPLVWSVPLLAIFIVGKSFHPWYYVQWALPLALLSGALFATASLSLAEVLPSILKFGTSQASKNLKTPNLGLVVLLILVALPPFFTEWQIAHSPTPEKTYQPLADYIRNLPTTTAAAASSNNITTIPNPNTTMLSFDPGFALLSGAQPVRLPSGKFLVDSAGYMVYLNLDMDQLGWGQLLAQVLSDKRQHGQVDTIFQLERAQALVSAAATSSNWLVLDVKLGLVQLTPQSVEYLANAAGQAAVMVGSTQLYQVATTNSSNSNSSPYQLANGLRLWALPLSLSQNQRANVVVADAKGTLRLSASQLKLGGALDLRLIWQVMQTPTQPGKLFVHLINSSGQTVAQSDLAPLQGQANIQDWQVGAAFEDTHSLPLPSNLASGTYAVQIGLYNPADNQRVLIEGQDSLLLGNLEIGTGS
jgi:hypothetical protein